MLDPRDPLGLAADAPLLAAYLAGLSRHAAGEHPFCTPGHKGATDLAGVVVAGDLAMAGGVDTVKFAHGVLAEAERRAAALWGAEICRFTVGGSTHGNQALALAVGRPGDTVIVSRTLHRSMLLGLVLAGLRPVWVGPTVDPDDGLPRGYDPVVVADALRAHPETVAVMLSDPAYVGRYSDLAAHAEVAHRAGIPLIVDAAWSAHFGFHPALPPHALAAGADAMVTSAHKTLPAYSQAALVLARTERIEAGRLHRAFEATYTTSPAGAILASVDGCRALLEHHGERLLGGLLHEVGLGRARLRAVDGLTVLDGPGVDPAKLALGLRGTGAHGIAVEAALIDRGLPLEMADRDTLVALATIGDDASALERLSEALATEVEQRRGPARPKVGAAAWIVEPEVVVDPRAAFFGAAQTVPTRRAIGRVCAELVAPYPPGVPVLAPGERITAATVATLRNARDDGVRIAYARDPTLATLEVLADAD